MEKTEKAGRICAECGDPIGAGRLKALPQAKICISCATERESSGRFKKHSMNITSEVSHAGEHEMEHYTLIRGDEE
jgi:hypothetical protein